MIGGSINKVISFGMILTFLVCTTANAANAVTDKQINDSINLGIDWLISQQKTDGSWGDFNQVGITGLAVAKLEDRANELGYTNPLNSPYGKNIKEGLNYIFLNAHSLDQDKIYFNTTGSDTLDYETSIAIMAITANMQKNEIVNVPGSAVNGMTYLDVANKAVNYIKYAQNNDGGWSYRDGYTMSDNSNTGYAVLGLDYANKKFCIDVSEVNSNLSNWITNLQCNDGGPSDGSAGYTIGTKCQLFQGILETGNLLYEMAFVGDNAGTPRAKNAIKFIQNNWNDQSWQPGWKGPGTPQCPQCKWSNYQATYTAMKGFEGMKIDEINIAGNPLNWFDDIASAIVKEQVLPDGYWNQTWESEDSNILATEWALLTLEKTVPSESRISIMKTANPSAGNPGTAVTFTINVTNTGKDLLNTVKVDDTLPAGMSYVPTGTSPTPDSIVNSGGSTTIIWSNIGPLAVKASKIITLMARIDINQNVTLTNDAKAIGTSPSLCKDITVTDESTARVKVIIPPKPVVRNPSKNFDVVQVGNDKAIAFEGVDPWPFQQKSSAKALNNLEILKNQNVGSEDAYAVNIEQIDVGNRESSAFGLGSAINNVKIVTNQR